MQDMRVRSLGQEDPVEKEMQPTPVFLSGRSHGQRSLIGLQSMGSHRVRHDWATKQLSSNTLRISGLLWVFGIMRTLIQCFFFPPVAISFKVKMKLCSLLCGEMRSIERGKKEVDTQVKKIRDRPQSWYCHILATNCFWIPDGSLLFWGLGCSVESPQFFSLLISHFFYIDLVSVICNQNIVLTIIVAKILSSFLI